MEGAYAAFDRRQLLSEIAGLEAAIKARDEIIEGQREQVWRPAELGMTPAQIRSLSCVLTGSLKEKAEQEDKDLEFCGVQLRKYVV